MTWKAKTKYSFWSSNSDSNRRWEKKTLFRSLLLILRQDVKKWKKQEIKASSHTSSDRLCCCCWWWSIKFCCFSDCVEQTRLSIVLKCYLNMQSVARSSYIHTYETARHLTMTLMFGPYSLNLIYTVFVFHVDDKRDAKVMQSNNKVYTFLYIFMWPKTAKKLLKKKEKLRNFDQKSSFTLTTRKKWNRKTEWRKKPTNLHSFPNDKGFVTARVDVRLLPQTPKSHFTIWMHFI